MNKIKEKLLKEIEEPKKDIDYWVRYWRRMQERGCNNFDEYLRIYEETSKAKDEKFIKLLDKLIKKIENADKQIEFDEWETFMIFNIQEIKQRIKEE